MDVAAQSSVYVKGLERRLGLYLIDWHGTNAVRLPIPTVKLWACPKCSFVAITTSQRGRQHGGDIIQQPSFTNGKRSGKLFLSGLCTHAHVVGPLDQADALQAADKWNAWCERHANARADRMRLEPQTRAEWIAMLSDPIAGQLRRES